MARVKRSSIHSYEGETTLYVGLEVHKEKAYGTVVDEKGNVIKEEKFDNTQDGFEWKPLEELILDSIEGIEILREKAEEIGNDELADKSGISRAMLYRNIDELRDIGYVSTEDGLVLTDAGKIARL